MKKILPLLVVSILTLSGLGAVATTSEKKTTSQTLQPELLVDFTGGFSVTVFIVNIGREPYKTETNIMIFINAPIMLVGQVSILSVPLPILPSYLVYVDSGLVLGFGKCTVTVSIDLDKDGTINAEGSADGFMLGPFILIRNSTPIIFTP